MLRGFMKGGEFENMPLNEFFIKCRERYGDTYLMPGLFGQPSNVVCFNVNDFEKVYRTEGTYPLRSGADALSYYRKKRKDQFFKGNMGLLSNGEQWWKLRHATNPVLMQHRNAALYMEPMQKVNEEFLQRIREIRDPVTMEMPDNFIDDINHLTFESVAVVALDRQFGLIRSIERTPEAEILFQNIQIFLQSFYDLGIKPSVYKYLPSATYKRFEKAMDEIFDQCLKYVNEAIARIESKPTNTKERSVLEKLLKIDRKFAMILAMDLLMVGVDTTSSVLSGILLCIAKHPEKQAKLREEILKVLPRKTDQFTMDTMKSLPYLRACIKESLRVYPIVFGNTRQTGMDIVLSGYRIPKGTRVLMNSNQLLSEERYFPRAQEYIPERWLRIGNDNTEKYMIDNLNPFIYLPFGFGPRTCAGKRIVDMELELTLSNLVRNFKIEYNYSTENAFKCYFINNPSIPLKFKFTELE